VEIAQNKITLDGKASLDAHDQVTLGQLGVGSRLVVRSRTGWRFAAVSKIVDERIVLTVCSPTGRTYRLRRDLDCEISIEGTIPILTCDEPENWRQNFCHYDPRW
jgi:hypothetical protein